LGRQNLIVEVFSIISTILKAISLVCQWFYEETIMMAKFYFPLYVNQNMFSEKKLNIAEY